MTQKFDDVFNTLFEGILQSDPEADLLVLCQCGICSDCTEDRPCGRTVFYDTSTFRKENEIDLTESETRRHTDLSLHYYTISNQRVPVRLEFLGNTGIREHIPGKVRQELIRQLSSIARSKVTMLRDCIVQASLTSTDLSSFSYKALMCLEAHLKFEGASVFFLEPQTHNIELSATTGIRVISSGKLSKKDVFYRENGKSFVSKCFQNANPIQEIDEAGLVQNTFCENAEMIFNRYFFPIKLRHEAEFQGSKRQPEPVFGVVRLVNFRKNGIDSPISSTDLELLQYFSEFIYILGRLYRKTSDPFGVLERATHGFINDLAVLNGQLGLYRIASKDTLPSAVRNILANESEKLSQNARRSLEVAEHEHNLQFQGLQRVLSSVLDYMSSQLHAILDTHGFSVGIISPEANAKVERPFDDAFVRLLESASFIAESHRRRPPMIRFLRSGVGGEDAIFFPALALPANVLYLVFRNLVENSVKYCDEHITPAIDIDWQQEGKSVVFQISDNGIGIDEEEEKDLFNQGFRARNAVLLATRGNGIGLEYARKSVELYDGSLTYVGKPKSGRGAIFEIRIPVSK